MKIHFLLLPAWPDLTKMILCDVNQISMVVINNKSNSNDYYDFVPKFKYIYLIMLKYICLS